MSSPYSVATSAHLTGASTNPLTEETDLNKRKFTESPTQDLDPDAKSIQNLDRTGVPRARSASVASTVHESDAENSALLRPYDTAMTDPNGPPTPSFFLARFVLKVSAKEYRRLLKMSLPVIFSYMLQNSLQTVSILIVGRLGAFELAVSAFSYMFAMSTGWLIQLGGTTAIDTLGSATYTASEDPFEYVRLVLFFDLLVF